MITGSVLLAAVLVSVAIGGFVGYKVGYSEGYEAKRDEDIKLFDEFARAEQRRAELWVSSMTKTTTVPVEQTAQWPEPSTT